MKGFKFLNRHGETTTRDPYTGEAGKCVYPLPYPDKKWGPWFVHPFPADYDGEDCGEGRWHIMKHLNARYAPINWCVWFADGQDILGESDEKFSCTWIRLRRIHVRTLLRLIRMGWCQECRLDGIFLSGADLSDALLKGANLKGANLKDARLHGANLTDANLKGADLTNTDLEDADMGHADLCGACLTGANLRLSNLTSARLEDADLTGASLQDANLKGAAMGSANLAGANLTGADLTCADLRGAILKGTILTGQDQ